MHTLNGWQPRGKSQRRCTGWTLGAARRSASLRGPIPLAELVSETLYELVSETLFRMLTAVPSLKSRRRSVARGSETLYGARE